MLETERLLLRRVGPEDADALVALHANPAVMRFIPPNRPLSRAESDELLAQVARHWDEHGYGQWGVALRAAPEHVIGIAGLAVPSFLPAVAATVEVGWRLARRWWGQGLATEAARACVSHAFGTLACEQVASVVEEGNHASMRVAEKLGMRPGPERVHPTTRRRMLTMGISSEDAASLLGGS